MSGLDLERKEGSANLKQVSRVSNDVEQKVPTRDFGLPRAPNDDVEGLGKVVKELYDERQNPYSVQRWCRGLSLDRSIVRRQGSRVEAW